MLAATRLVLSLSLLAPFAAAQAPDARPAEPAGKEALAGDWLYVEDRTEGREPDQHQPSMSGVFCVRIEDAAAVVVRGSGSSQREIRIAFDGTASEATTERAITSYRGEWKDGALVYTTESVRPSDRQVLTTIRTEMRPVPEGLLVSVEVLAPTKFASVALYRHPQDFPLPAAKKATIADLAWLAGAWVGTKGKSVIEERWSPPRGGSMLAVSRTVSGEKLVMFEFLRVVERDGGLVYVAQPGGRTPTEFVLTELDATHAVFDNPRHDFPQRIAYEVIEGGGLRATIGRIQGGGRGQTFEWKREEAHAPESAPRK